MAGKYGAAVLTITTPRDPSSGGTDLKGLWDIAEKSAAEHGQNVSRDDWRLVLPVHLAETRKEAMDQARLGAGRYQREYFETTMGRAQMVDGPLNKVIDGMVERGAWIVGTPEDCVTGIRRLAEQSGGFGGFLVQTVDWAPREAMLHSYELLARYVMPQFQGSAAGTAASNTWAFDRRDVLMAGRTRAIDAARQSYAQRHAVS